MDLDAAGVRPFGISRDSPWAQRAFAESLGVEFCLLSDWAGEAVAGFGVGKGVLGMAGVPERTAFLVRDGVVRAAWLLGRELPDVDAVIAAARADS